MDTEFNITFNYNNGAITLENNRLFEVDFNNEPSRYQSLGYQLGFRKDKYLSTAKVVSGTATFSVVSESQLDTVGDAYIFLKLNDYGVIYHDFEDILTKDSSGEIINRQRYVGDKNVFAKIILNTNKAEHVFDNGSNFLTKSFTFRQPIDLDRFTIELSDPKGNLLEMVHMDFSMTLEVGIVYDSSVSYDLTDSLTNKFMLTGLPSLPVIDNVSKSNRTINIINDGANQNNNLINNKINLNEKEFQDLYSIFENGDSLVLPNDNSDNKEEIKPLKKKKKDKKKFNFSY
jgi:hypothetical protein